MSLKDRFEKKLMKKGVLETAEPSAEASAAAPPLELAVNNDAAPGELDNYAEAGEDSPQAFGLYRSPGQHPSVKIHLANGRAHHLFYARLQEIICYDDDVLMLICATGYIMSIEGKKLTALGNLLGHHKVQFIKENARGDNGLMVGKITVEFMNDTLQKLISCRAT
ncbi:MAG: hypothetical protein KDJ99_27225 [Candidatus Competibacteraceae bacterium]|nr:hypothetical protein [Candidatus Competibacteraceae bacterium]